MYASEPLNVSPYSMNAAVRKNADIIYGSEYNGLTHFQATRRKVVVSGLLATLGITAVVADFLYGGSIRNALYPQNTTRGQEMTSLTDLLTSTSNQVLTTSSKTYTYKGRLFFDKGTSTFGTAGNGKQDDTDSEPGEQNAKILFLDVNSNPVATATTDSSGDFSTDLPKGKFTAYPVISDESKNYGYMCQSLDEFRKVSDGYPITVGDNNPKLSVGLMQGWLSYPPKGIDKLHGYCYDRDPSNKYLAWNGDTEGSENNNPGTHFSANLGDTVYAFAPGIVTGVYPDMPENWITISTQSKPWFDLSFAHNSEVLLEKGQKVSRYQAFAKAGNRGCRGCDSGVAVVHFQAVHLGNPLDGNNDTYLFFDPYRPVFPITKDNSGMWGVRRGEPTPHWVNLPPEQNPNWNNHWIVENQTHF